MAVDLAELNALLGHLNARVFSGRARNIRLDVVSQCSIRIVHGKTTSTPSQSRNVGTVAEFDAMTSSDGVNHLIKFNAAKLNRKTTPLTLVHEVIHTITPEEADDHGPQWVAGMEAVGTRVTFFQNPDGHRGATESLIPGGPLDLALTEFYGEQHRPVVTAKSAAQSGSASAHRTRKKSRDRSGDRPQSHPSIATTPCKWLIAMDGSGSMFREAGIGKKTKYDIARAAVKEWWPAHGARLLLFNGIITEMQSPNYLPDISELCSDSSTMISLICPVLDLAAKIKPDIFIILSDGIEYEDEFAIFASRARSSCIIKAHCILEDGHQVFLDGNDLMQRLCRDGGFTVGSRQEDVVAALGDNASTEPAPNFHTISSPRQRPGYEREISAAAEHAANTTAINTHFADLGDIIGGLAHRVSVAEDRATARGARDDLMAGADLVASQVFGQQFAQLGADMQYQADASAAFRAELQTAGAGLGRDVADLFAGIVGDQTQRRATSVDTSAPVQIGGFDIDMSVFTAPRSPNQGATPSNIIPMRRR